MYATHYAERQDLLMRKIYGPFAPDTDARRVRHENEAAGLKTCWWCIRPFRRLQVSVRGKTTDTGQGASFCSWSHYRAYQAETARLRRELEEMEAAA